MTINNYSQYIKKSKRSSDDNQKVIRNYQLIDKKNRRQITIKRQLDDNQKLLTMRQKMEDNQMTIKR